MQKHSSASAVFTTITDVDKKTHVDTLFFGSLLEQQLAQSQIREKYQGDEYVIVTHPGVDQARSAEINDVIYQARMQSLILGSLPR